MATLSNSDRPQNTPRKHLRRMRPHMDFTPMVDLGFLLITFFMLSTSLSKPNVMPLVMPDSYGDPAPAKASKVLTILLGDADKVYWYEGLELEKADSTTFDRNGLRSVLLQKMKKVHDQWGLQTYLDPKTGQTRQGSQLSVILKPGKNSNYKNLVDALDEMAIAHVRYYVLLEPSEVEREAIAAN